MMSQGTILGSLLVGALAGLLPLCLGLWLEQRRLAWASLAASVGNGFLFGIKGSLPTAIFLSGMIFAQWYRQRRGKSRAT